MTGQCGENAPEQNVVPLKRTATPPRESASELRQRAAVMAIDMEQGRWLDPHTGERWPEGRAPSKTRIARALGYGVANRKPLSFMREPEWTRAVEFERIRRESDGGLSPQRLHHLLRVVTNGMLVELARRVLLEPERIENRTLITETRQLVTLGASLAGGSQPRGDVEKLVSDFAQQVRLLPPQARERALRGFQEEIGRIVVVMRSLDGVTDVKPANTPELN